VLDLNRDGTVSFETADLLRQRGEAIVPQRFRDVTVLKRKRRRTIGCKEPQP
jgi:hypothetical protein